MIKFVLKYLDGYKFEFSLIVFCAMMNSIADLSMPYLSSKFIDEVLVTRDIEGLYFFVVMLILINILAVISNWFFVIRSTIIRAKLTNNVAENLMRRVQKLKSEFLIETDMIYLSKRISTDSDDLIAFILGSIIDVSIQSAMLIMAIYLLQSIGIKWIAIFLIVAAIHAGIFAVLRERLFQISKEVRETESRYFTSFSDNFFYVYSIKLHAMYEEFLTSFRNSFDKFFDASISEAKIRFWFAYGRSNETKIFTVLIFLLGGIDVLDGNLSIGNFVALNGYYLFAMQSVAYFMNVGQDYQNARSAYNRIMEIQNLPIELNGSKILDRIERIEVKNLDFSFGDRKILTDFSMNFKRGKIYCIVGKNGSGKSTLLNLICGMIHPIDGKIYFNGISLSELDMIYARKHLISVVEQKDFVRNDKLSGGERRKVLIDSALKKSAGVLIMDEPDNNLDVRAIDDLIAAIVHKKESRITIIISHDDRILKIADETIFF